MAIVDADYKFTYVDIGAYGKDWDSSVFQHTTFFKMMVNRQLQIPQPSPLHSAGIKNFPFVFVADEAFGLPEYVMRPYAGHNLPEKKRIFNYRLTLARRYVECAFGILANKWRILHRALNVRKEFAKDIVKACIILHNLVRIKDAQILKMYITQQKLQTFNKTLCNRPKRIATALRDDLADYFMAEGALP
ncbi:protein ALP1-like [Sitophilus oryzae]|uniref:Protein ALP1-like n=1 Tax=Sitophilus oryzae TaxID=7048 RepID=A0A6J2X6Z5_SITOR|nr:protein ALP1-like [Sitophilus oryzae]